MNTFLNSNLSKSENKFFKPKEGANKLRILTTPVSYYNFFDYSTKRNYTDYEYFEKSSNRFMVYVQDLAEEKPEDQIKIYEMPTTVAKQIQALAKDEDYAFVDFPMPYNIKLSATNAGTKEVSYTITPSPKLTEVPEEVKEILAKKKTCEEIVKAKVERTKKEQKEEGFKIADGEFANVPKEKKERGGMNDDLGSIDYGDSINPEDIPF